MRASSVRVQVADDEKRRPRPAAPPSRPWADAPAMSIARPERSAPAQKASRPPTAARKRPPSLIRPARASKMGATPKTSVRGRKAVPGRKRSITDILSGRKAKPKEAQPMGDSTNGHGTRYSSEATPLRLGDLPSTTQPPPTPLRRSVPANTSDSAMLEDELGLDDSYRSERLFRL